MYRNINVLCAYKADIQRIKGSPLDTIFERIKMDQDPTIFNPDSSIYSEYFRLTEYFCRKYGPSTIFLLQVGAFFEIYGIKYSKEEWVDRKRDTNGLPWFKTAIGKASNSRV